MVKFVQLWYELHFTDPPLSFSRLLGSSIEIKSLTNEKSCRLMEVPDFSKKIFMQILRKKCIVLSPIFPPFHAVEIQKLQLKEGTLA